MDKPNKKNDSSGNKGSDKLSISEEKFYDCGDVETKAPNNKHNTKNPIKNNTKDYRTQNARCLIKDASKKPTDSSKNVTVENNHAKDENDTRKASNENTNTTDDSKSTKKPVKAIPKTKIIEICENKPKLNENSKSKINLHETLIENSTNNKEELKVNKNNVIKKPNKKEEAIVLTEYDRRKKIKEKYTLKLKPIVLKEEVKVDPNSRFHERATDTNDDYNTKGKLIKDETKIPNNNISTTTFKIEGAKPKDENRSKKAEIEPTHKRKPLIKTVMAKNSVLPVYKDVKFIDSKTKPVPLQIKIPNENSPQKISKDTDTSSLNTKSKALIDRLRPDKQESKKVVVRNRIDFRRIVKKKRRVLSPDMEIRTPSPPTEVAKWAPSCIDELTKPYYEAWVNTTLTAISKDRTFTYNKFMNSLKKSLFLDRPKSNDYMKDERYTGKIKVTQR